MSCICRYCRLHEDRHARIIRKPLHMTRLHPRIPGTLLTIAVFAWPNLAVGAPRDVQFRSINLAQQIVELHNFGVNEEPLDGWRFCTHDEDQARRYSSPGGLNGFELAPGESLFVHFANDAPAEEGHVDIDVLGGDFVFALPLDSGGYGMQIYFPPTNFGDGQQIADYVQWGIDGAGSPSAATRAGAAEQGGVWTDRDQWVPTTSNTVFLLLEDASGTALHGPEDYLVFIPGDTNGDRNVNLEDFTTLKDNFGGSASITEGDVTLDGVVDLNDFSLLKDNFGRQAAVPEPATLWLISCGVLLVAARSRLFTAPR